MSAIPSHMSTAIFATCGVSFWAFAISTFLTLPKQLLLVYLGVLIVDVNQNKVPKYMALFVGGAVTAVMAWYIYRKMRKYKKELLAEQTERQKQRLRKNSNASYPNQPLMSNGDEIEPAGAAALACAASAVELVVASAGSGRDISNAYSANQHARQPFE